MGFASTKLIIDRLAADGIGRFIGIPDAGRFAGQFAGSIAENLLELVIAADDEAIPHQDDTGTGGFEDRVLLLVDGRQFGSALCDSLFHLLIDQLQFPCAQIDLMFQEHTADQAHDQKTDGADAGYFQPERQLELDFFGSPLFQGCVIDRLGVIFQLGQMAVDRIAQIFWSV